MRKLKRIALLSFSLVLFTQALYSQEDVVQVLSGNLSDAKILTKAYLEPFGKSFGTSLNNGWYNTAKPHKLFGFDLTFTAAITVPPSSDRTFDVSKLNLQYWDLQDPNNKLSPTVTGAKENGVGLTNTTDNVNLTLPQGANLRFIPAPIVQVGFGLPFHTEVMGRFFPKVDISGVGNFSLWGVGVKNEFKEFIPGFKMLPIDVSVLLGYTKFQSSFDINSTKKQTLEFNASGFTGKLLISKSIPVLTVYAGVGYSKSTTDVALKGTYDLTLAGVSQSVTDPVSLSFVNNGINANIGLRIKLAVLAFHFDYSLGKYAIYNAGVGINFR